MWRKGSLQHYWWRCKLPWLSRKSVGTFLKHLKIQLPYDTGMPLPGIQWQEMRSAYKGDIGTCVFIIA